VRVEFLSEDGKIRDIQFKPTNPLCGNLSEERSSSCRIPIRIPSSERKNEQIVMGISVVYGMGY
jgi:hypothetical protein